MYTIKTLDKQFLWCGHLKPYLSLNKNEIGILNLEHLVYSEYICTDGEAQRHTKVFHVLCKHLFCADTSHAHILGQCKHTYEGSSSVAVTEKRFAKVPKKHISPSKCLCSSCYFSQNMFKRSYVVNTHANGLVFCLFYSACEYTFKRAKWQNMFLLQVFIMCSSVWRKFLDNYHTIWALV